MAGMLVAADGDNPLPVDAQKIVNVLGVKIAELQLQAVKDLRKVQDAATRNGNLDAAVAVRDVANDLDKQLVSNTDVLVSSIGKPLDKAVLGKWTLETGAWFVLTSGGTANWHDEVSGTWTTKSGKLVINWRNGNVDTYELLADGQLTQLNKAGTVFRRSAGGF
jgi:hypothetical protein